MTDLQTHAFLGMRKGQNEEGAGTKKGGVEEGGTGTKEATNRSRQRRAAQAGIRCKLLHSRLLVEAAVAAVFGEAGVERKKTGGPGWCLELPQSQQI